MSETWPVADLNPVRRLRVLAAATPGALLAETTIPATFDEVWSVASDLESELPRFLPDVRSLRITAVDGERLEAVARGYAGLRARFDVVLRPGWCVMRSRFLLGGMAAVAEPAGTRFAFLGALQTPAARLLGPILAAGAKPAGNLVLRRFTARVQHRADRG
jgi:hypothetical protein